LTETCGENVAHDDGVDGGGVEAGAIDGCAQSVCPQFGCREAREGTVHLCLRCAGSGENDNVTRAHGCFSSERVRAVGGGPAATRRGLSLDTLPPPVLGC